ncbi:unnamed protein product [Prorocentrum cordatum]|uniref:Transmembrane protein n=1 Tax=Prorocentrum cordatum TaxID=2364126 RepID=A0ABN9R001_9DINO|nr:unnamed protein product [Polarella glacialis]
MSLSCFLAVGQQDCLVTIVVRSCVFLSFGSLVALVWLGWDNSVASLYALRKVFQSPASPPLPCTSFDNRVSNALDKARVARLQHVADSLLIPISAGIFVPLAMFINAADASDRSVAFKAVIMCVRHFATLYWKYLRCSSGFSVADIKNMFIFFMSFIAVRTYFEESHVLFFMYGGFWSAARVLLAVGLLDCRMSGRWNMFLSAVTCLSSWERREQLRIHGHSPMGAFVHQCMVELVTCGLICFASAFLEACEKDRVKASIQSSQSGRAYQAAQTLLGVFCDAQLRICPQCNIIAHSPHLLHLLGSGGTRHTLHGCSFLQYLLETDQQRFQDFISGATLLQQRSQNFSSERNAASIAEGPSSSDFSMGHATSTQVSLRKEGCAHPIPVELFLINIADVQDAPEFLMGIRETCEALPREACTDAPRAEALQRPAAAPSLRGLDPEAGRGGAVQCPRAERPVHKVGRKPRSSISSSSRASSSSAGSCAPDAGRVSSVCLRLDSKSRGLRVEDMLLRFEGGRRSPCLKDWLPKETVDEVRRSSQDLVNQRDYGPSGEELVAGVGAGTVRFSSGGSTFLLAERAALAVDGYFIDPRDSGEESDYFSPFIFMYLSGVSKLRVPWQSVPQRVSNRLHPIDESPTDAAYGGSASTLRRRTNEGAGEDCQERDGA